MGRVDGRGEREIFDTLPFQEKVRRAYEESLSEFSHSGVKILRIDATRSIEAVTEAVMDGINAILAGPATP
jgi:thymidylate kinase